MVLGRIDQHDEIFEIVDLEKQIGRLWIELGGSEGNLQVISFHGSLQAKAEWMNGVACDGGVYLDLQS